MNKTNQKSNSIEEALAMYKENVSPSETSLQAILSQIPEQQNLKEGRAVRSPYRWLAITQTMTVFAIVLILLPITPQTETQDKTMANQNPYYEVDKDIESFEASLEEEDATLTLRNSFL